MSTLPAGGNGMIACTTRVGQSAAVAEQTPNVADAALAIRRLRRVIMMVLPFMAVIAIKRRQFKKMKACANLRRPV
jgi:hypothetical protein